MNIYKLTRKELNALEKEFAKTAFGQKVRIPVLVSIMALVIWLIIVVASIIVTYNCMMWFQNDCYGNGYGNYSSCFDMMSTDMSAGVISFVIIVAMCVFSAANYYRELRKFASSKQ